MEEWRDVVGYEGWYSVSNLGRVCRVAPGPSTTPGKILFPERVKKGYFRVNLSRNGVVRRFMVHRLVVTAFLPSPPPGHNSINHKDGTKTNNCVDNLEWTTPKKNTHHAKRLGLLVSVRGERHGHSKLSDAKVRRIRKLAGKYTLKELSKKMGVSEETVSRVIRRKSWVHVD